MEKRGSRIALAKSALGLRCSLTGRGREEEKEREQKGREGKTTNEKQTKNSEQQHQNVHLFPKKQFSYLERLIF